MAQAAVPVGKHGEQREAFAEVLVDHLRAPDFVRAAFAQAEQAGGVVDLAVEQDDRADRRIARPTRRLEGREGGDLGTDVGRGVAEDPALAVVGQGDGGLRAWLGRYAAVADPATVAAVAVPLGKRRRRPNREYGCAWVCPAGWREAPEDRGRTDQRLAK